VDLATTNGGFPLPPAGAPAHEVACRHAECDGDTRVRLPLVVPPRAVRRVVCARCAEPYEPARVREAPERKARALGLVSLPSVSLPSPSVPSLNLPSPSWRWLGLPVAALVVVGALLLVQGDEDEGTAPSTASAPTLLPDAAGDSTSGRVERSGGNAGGAAGAAEDATLVSESTFQLALPADWEESAPSGGATFAAVAPGGDADVMLWVEHDPKLDFATFEARSLAQLESLAGSAAIVERNPGPTPETTTSVLAPTSAASDAPNYEVLISGGPRNYWYYMATTSQPGAPAETAAAVELLQGSFLPQGGGR
jgi:hypothetical protein